MNQRKRRRPRPGFTLMEVLLVLAILVILGSLVVFNFARVQQRGYEDATKSQISMFEQPLHMFKLDIGSYPATNQGLEGLIQVPSDLAAPQKWRGPYLDDEVPADPWGNPYQYELLGPDAFRVWSWGPDGQNATADDISS
jgi:general secretion pathway protein G